MVKKTKEIEVDMDPMDIDLIIVAIFDLFSDDDDEDDEEDDFIA